MYLDKRIHDYETEWPSAVEPAKELRAELEKPGAVSLKVGTATGGVYQVDVPDEHVNEMLDYDAPLKDQPEPVKNVVREILKEKKYLGAGDNGPRQLSSAFDAYVMSEGGFIEGRNGAAVYAMIQKAEREKLTSALTDKLHALEIDFPGGARLPAAENIEAHNDILKQIHQVGADDAKRASLRLKDAGVPGLRYYDGGSRDAGNGTRNVVVFDPDIVTLTHKNGEAFTPAERKQFLQGGTPETPERRGSIRFGPDRQFEINLFEKANLSTFLHETGHFFLEVFGDVADQLQQQDPESLNAQQKHVLSDYGTTLQALGVEHRDQITTEHHEQFARMFEAYLMEGKAPSVGLATTFARFRAWLVGVYQSLKKLHVELTPEVRGVMDRLLVSDQAIADAEAQRGVEPMFTSPDDVGMTPEQFAPYMRTVADASKLARERLDKKLLSEVAREQTRQWNEARADVEARVTDQVDQLPEQRAIAAMRKGTHPDGTPLKPLEEGESPTPIRINRKMIADAYGAERLRRLPRGITAKDGVDPDLVARMFGYTSADAMLTAVEQAPERRAVIEQETKRQMIAEHGSILLDGTLQDHAAAAVSNEVREDVIRAEMRALGRKKREVEPFVAAERAAGRQTLADAQAERDYERRWFEAETKLKIAIAEGEKQSEIDALTKEVRDLRAKARGGAATIRAAIPDSATLDQAANERIAGMIIGDIRPEVFWSASRRAAQKALEHAARGEYDEAITAKQQELINSAMFRKATAALDDVNDRIEFAKSLGTKASRMRFGKAGYLDQVDAILDRFEFVPVSRKVLERRANINKWVQGIEAQGLPVDLPDVVLDESRRRNYKQLTVEELEGVTDGLKQLQHLSRLKNRLLKSAEKRDLDTVANAAAANIMDKANSLAPQIHTDRLNGNKGRLVQDMFGSVVRLADDMRELDGGEDGGPMATAILAPLNEAGAREATMLADATKRLGALLEEAYPRGEKSRLDIKMNVKEVGQSLSKMDRLFVALNWGNQGNRDVLMRSEKWTPDQVQAILETLDARDLKFVQGALDLVNSYKAEMFAKQVRVYGIEPTNVDPTPFTTRQGTVDGGYFPLKYNDQLDARAAKNVDLESGNLAKLAAYGQATTNRGFTIDRKAGVSLKIRRDFGVISQHLTQVIHDLTHHEALIDVGRILAHPAITKAIYDKMGDLAYKRIKGSIRDIAFGAGGAQNGMEKSLGYLRAGGSIATLGWSAVTPLLHLSGALPKAMNRIGTEWVTKGMVHWMRDAASMESSADWVNSVSETMRNRWRTNSRDLFEINSALGVDTGKFSGFVADVLDKVSLGTVDKQKIADSYFYLVSKSQQMADIPTFLGAYEKAKSVEGTSDEAAVQQAEQAVLDAFGGGQIKDLPAVMRGGPFLKAWTQFYGPFNSSFNLLRASYRDTTMTDPASIGRFGVDFLMLTTVPAVLNYAIRSAFRGGPANKHDWDNAESIALSVVKENAAFIMDLMPLTRELSGMIEGRDYAGPAGASFFADATKAGFQISRVAKAAEKGKELPLDYEFFKAQAAVAGILFHLPVNQFVRTVGGLQSMIEGKTSNPGALIAGPPPKHPK